MRKIPVGDTISKAYGFAFADFLSIFGIAWLPYLTVGIIAAGLVFLVAPDLPRELMQGEFDPFALLPVVPLLGLLVVLLFIAGCMVVAGIQRKALGRHPKPVFVYFSLGAPVWRMAGAFFLAWLAIVAIGAVTAAVTVAVWFAVWRLNSPYLEIVRCLAILVAACWLVYMSVRLTFLLPAVVVAEERIGLGRAWELGGGNFWRMFAVVIAVFVPVAIGLGILEMVVFGASVAIPWNLRPDMAVDELGRALLRQYGALGLVAVAFQVIERILFMGLGNGMSASAYLALVQPVSDPAKEL